jgi:hypothetical protein
VSRLTKWSNVIRLGSRFSPNLDFSPGGGASGL